MENLALKYISHKHLYLTSIGAGGFATYIIRFFQDYTPKEVFGIAFGLWAGLLVINIIDVRTGILADKIRRERDGERFRFVSRKGWRAIEKIFVFTAVIFFLYNFEAQLLTYQYPQWIVSGVMTVKIGVFVYTTLVEIQSIGENNEVRFGKKEKIYLLLDNIVIAINDGILGWIKRQFKK